MLLQRSRYNVIAVYGHSSQKPIAVWLFVTQGRLKIQFQILKTIFQTTLGSSLTLFDWF